MSVKLVRKRTIKIVKIKIYIYEIQLNLASNSGQQFQCFKGRFLTHTALVPKICLDTWKWQKFQKQCCLHVTPQVGTLCCFRDETTYTRMQTIYHGI